MFACQIGTAVLCDLLVWLWLSVSVPLCNACLKYTVFVIFDSYMVVLSVSKLKHSGSSLSAMVMASILMWKLIDVMHSVHLSLYIVSSTEGSTVVGYHNQVCEHLGPPATSQLISSRAAQLLIIITP